jgi:hypothetical protein
LVAEGKIKAVEVINRFDMMPGRFRKLAMRYGTVKTRSLVIWRTEHRRCQGSIEFSASCISEGAPSWLHHPSIITEQEASMHHAITTELAAMMMDQSISTSTDSNSDALNDSGSLMNSGAS